MVSYWKFNGDANDYFGTNNGTNSGATTAAGKVGNALSFNGSSNYVSVPDSSSLDLTEFTLEAWVYMNTLKNYNNILEKGNDGSENYEMIAYENGYVSMPILFTNGTRTWEADAPAGTLAAGQWYHIVQTYKSGEWRFYKNGTAITNITSITKTPQVNSGVLNIGRSNASGRYFDGLIDEVAVYNRALTANEILAHYNRSSGGAAYCQK